MKPSLRNTLFGVAGAALLSGCAPAVKLPSVLEPLSSTQWKSCADEAAMRESMSMIDDMTLDAKTLLCRGVVAAADGKTDEGLDMLNRAAVQNDDDYRAHYLTGRVLAEAGRYEEALSAFERSAKRNPQMEVPTERLGRSIMEKNGDKEALGFLVKADGRSLCPYSCKGLLARLYHRTGDDEKAKSIYNRMLLDNPGDPNAHVGIAAIQNGSSDYESESDSLTRAVESAGFLSLSTGEQAAIHYSHAFARYNARKFKGAAKSIERALKLEFHPDWLLLAGWIQLKLEDPAMALVQFDKAIAADEKLAPAYAGKGDALLSLRRASDAVDAFKIACERDEKSALFQLKLAFALATDGDNTGARAALDKALEMDGAHLPGDLVQKVRKMIGSADPADSSDTTEN